MGYLQGVQNRVSCEGEKNDEKDYMDAGFFITEGISIV
jgi:hypothetical protein